MGQTARIRDYFIITALSLFAVAMAHTGLTAALNANHIACPAQTAGW